MEWKNVWHAKKKRKKKMIYENQNCLQKPTELKMDDVINEYRLPLISSNGITLGSFGMLSPRRICLNVFKRFMLRRINCCMYCNQNRN